MAIDVEEYYRRYVPMVLRRCRRMLRDEEEAVDAMQDTFVQLLLHRKRLKHEAPSSLLYRMATFICLNKLRKRSRKVEHPDGELLGRIDDIREPESRLTARLRLDRLFARERTSTLTIAVLHLVDGMTLEEVAEEVGLSVSGVRKRLRRLRGHLKELEGV